MSSVRYIISDASKKIDVEPHVLRYWEEELGLSIPRNEMGHRYYREEDIDTLKTVKRLKEEGFQLRAIKMVLPDIHKIEKLDSKNILRLREELNQQVMNMEQEEREVKAHNGTSIVSFEQKAQAREKNRGTSLAAKEKADVENAKEEDKMCQFKSIMHSLIAEALRENNRELSQAVGGSVSDNVLKEMDYMMRMQEEREEERFKKLDEVIRGQQKVRKEIAATEIRQQKKTKKGLFKKQKKFEKF